MIFPKLIFNHQICKNHSSLTDQKSRWHAYIGLWVAGHNGCPPSNASIYSTELLQTLLREDLS